MAIYTNGIKVGRIFTNGKEPSLGFTNGKHVFTSSRFLNEIELDNDYYDQSLVDTAENYPEWFMDSFPATPSAANTKIVHLHSWVIAIQYDNGELYMCMNDLQGGGTGTTGCFYMPLPYSIPGFDGFDISIDRDGLHIYTCCDNPGNPNFIFYLLPLDTLVDIINGAAIGLIMTNFVEKEFIISHCFDQQGVSHVRMFYNEQADPYSLLSITQLGHVKFLKNSSGYVSHIVLTVYPSDYDDVFGLGSQSCMLVIDIDNMCACFITTHDGYVTTSDSTYFSACLNDVTSSLYIYWLNENNAQNTDTSTVYMLPLTAIECNENFDGNIYASSHEAASADITTITTGKYSSYCNCYPLYDTVIYTGRSIDYCFEYCDPISYTLSPIPGNTVTYFKYNTFKSQRVHGEAICELGSHVAFAYMDGSFNNTNPAIYALKKYNKPDCFNSTIWVCSGVNNASFVGLTRTGRIYHFRSDTFLDSYSI